LTIKYMVCRLYHKEVLALPATGTKSFAGFLELLGFFQGMQVNKMFFNYYIEYKMAESSGL